MSRLFLVILLSACQLAAQAGVRRYACIRSDGSRCCIDQGELFCSCQNECARETKSTEPHGCCHDCDEKDHKVDVSAVLSLTASSDCLHVPLGFDCTQGQIHRMPELNGWHAMPAIECMDYTALLLGFKTRALSLVEAIDSGQRCAHTFAVLRC